MAFFDRWVRIEFHRRQATAQWKRLFHFVTSLPVCLVHKTMYLSATPWNQPLSGRELNSTRVFWLCQTAVVHRKSKGDLSTLKTTVMSGDLQCLAGVFWRGGGGKILWRKGHTLVLLAFFFFFIAIDFTVGWHLMTIKFTRNYLGFLFFSCLFFNLVFGKNKKR